MGKNCKTLDFLGGCNFRKGKDLSFVEPTVRDREVGGSNPLAPTNNLPESITTVVSVNGRFSSCGQFVDKSF